MITLLVTAGRGPAEVRAFVHDLGPALVDLLQGRGRVVGAVERGPGHVRIPSEGEAPVEDLVGTHALIAALRGRGARRRWFAGVLLLPPSPPPTALDPRDVAFRADRAGGPGGQHVNTTASAVRATHLPTGHTVRVASERSQHANRREALRRLARDLADRHQAALATAAEASWQGHERVVRGDPVATWHRCGDHLILEALRAS